MISPSSWVLIASPLVIGRTACSKWPSTSHRWLGQFWERVQSVNCPAQLEGGREGEAEGQVGGWLFSLAAAGPRQVVILINIEFQFFFYCKCKTFWSQVIHVHCGSSWFWKVNMITPLEFLFLVRLIVSSPGAPGV